MGLAGRKRVWRLTGAGGALRCVQLLHAALQLGNLVFPNGSLE